MKITESQLRSIVRQELKKTLNENEEFDFHRDFYNPKRIMQLLNISNLNELKGKTVKYHLSEQGHFGKGMVASVNSKKFQFTLDPNTVMHDFAPISHEENDWRKPEGLRNDEITQSIGSIAEIVSPLSESNESFNLDITKVDVNKAESVKKFINPKNQSESYKKFKAWLDGLGTSKPMLADYMGKGDSKGEGSGLIDRYLRIQARKGNK